LDLDGVSAAGTAAARRLDVRRPNGELLPVEALVSRLPRPGGEVRTVVLHDMSVQQQMEQALYEARKTQALGALAGGIAHDFNNILTAVISQIDLAMHAPEFPDSLKDHLVYAQTSARRGAELVQKLQTFSRQNKPEIASLDMEAVLDQVAFVLRRSVGPNILIQCPKPSVKPWIARGDANQIMQALLNLGVNARDAMPQGGTLSLTLENAHFDPEHVTPPRRAGDFVQVTAEDTGQGMTPEVASQVFEPYFTTKDRSRGQGLGLSITSAVVAEHAGWMEVASQPGRGTRFSLFLPRSAQPAPTAKPAPLPDTKATDGKEQIMVVDDEELVRMVTKAMLAYRGYRIVEAEDGLDAVEKFAREPHSIDLILMDVHMPRLNGYDALLRIREINPKAKAILLSGGVHDPDTGLGQVERVAFLHKPFENQELLRLVRQLLDSED
jgi:signal transduction histidine kinase